MLCNNNVEGKDRFRHMASQQTPNYRLSRWAGTDRILVEEFNDNWDKIDTALAAHNCQFYTASYVGDGQTTLNLTFPHKPMILFITRDDTVGVGLAIRGCLRAQGLNSTDGVAPLATWGEHDVTLQFENHQISYFNTKDDPYTLLALLNVNN